MDGCIKNYGHNKLYTQLITQKAIIHYNSGNYTACLNTFKDINIKELVTQSRNNYYFMKGHIGLLEKNYDDALNYLLKCEKYFISQHYYRDLIYVYEDLSDITKDEIYKHKATENKLLSGRRNIY